ncbi:MAG: S8 family serine peptidase [Pyrinomonadaceae bacterium]
MNKKNIWLHIGLAALVVTLAAIAGQFNRIKESSSIVYSKKDVPFATQEDRDAEVPEVLIKFREGVTNEQIQNITSGMNDRIEDQIESVPGLYSIDDLDDRAETFVASQYEDLSDLVEYAEPNTELFLDDPVQESSQASKPAELTNDENLPNDPMLSEQWALNNDGQNGGKANADLGAFKAWKKNHGTDEVVVAVLDSGVDYAHEDLVENIWFRPDNIPVYQDEELGVIDDEHGYNAVENSGDPMDQNGHGTHCAGVIGARGNNEIGVSGINWQVQIMPLKFMGRGGFGTTKDAIEAINYAIERKKAGINVRVINASWGSTQYSKALEDSIRAAGKEGILFVAAAGNNSTDNDKRAHYPSNYNLPNVVSVAALDRSDSLAGFSNYGAKTVHIAAPGKDILSTWLDNQYREASGTSMAAPQVAGVAALIVAENPDISVENLRAKLVSSVDKLEFLKGKVESGGRLNAAKALQ